jgi:hypothetical protein
MARLDFPDYSPLRPAAEPVGLQASSTESGALPTLCLCFAMRSAIPATRRGGAWSMPKVHV